MTKETYLYFAENLGGDAAGDALTVPASNFFRIRSCICNNK